MNSYRLSSMYLSLHPGFDMRCPSLYIHLLWRVADRLGYFLSRTKQPPQIFRTLHDQLPLLIQTFEEIKIACEKEKISVEQQ